jgi:pilus assembly protein CpaE
MSLTRENKKIRVLIVDDIVETRENLKKLLYFEDDIEIVGAAGNGREGVEQAAALQPDIVLMDINMPGMDGIAASEQISATNPAVQVIMMSVQGESDYLRRSMLAGAREFLIKPFSSEELATSIRRVYQLGAARRATQPATPAPTPPESSAHGSPPSALSPKPAGAKIMAMFSPKGGAGVTTIAVNLAVALREETKARVAIFDASFQFGDVGVMMNLPTTRSIADIMGVKHEPDEDILNGVMATHSSGVKVLLAPPRPEMAELVTVEHLRAVLNVMRRMFDYVIIDTGKSINDALLAIFDAAEQIILISTADIAALKNAKLFFEVTDALEYPPGKTILVVNKEDGRSGINAKDIEGNIKHPVAGSILRDDRTTAAALNRGIPFVIMQRGSGVSQAMFALARLLRREPEPLPVVIQVAPPPPAPKTKMEPLKPARRLPFFWRS